MFIILLFSFIPKYYYIFLTNRTSSPRYPPFRHHSPPSKSHLLTPLPSPHHPRHPTANAHRKIGIAVDWAVHHYLRTGDAVVLIHVRPTYVLYGADWGSVDENEESQRKLEDEFDAFTTTKASDLAQPLVEAQIPFKIHIVKDHDMKERLCLEVERLWLSTLITGSRGLGVKKRESNERLGSVSDYCVRHCVCPVVVVRYSDEKDGVGGAREPVVVSVASAAEEADEHR